MYLNAILCFAYLPCSNISCKRETVNTLSILVIPLMGHLFHGLCLHIILLLSALVFNKAFERSE